MRFERNPSEASAKEGKFILYALILAFLGFLDASYLTILHYKNVIPPCTIGGCETVLTSEFSVILGIPLSLLGSLFYLSVIVLCLLILTNYQPAGRQGRKMFLQLFYIQAILGFIVSLALLGLQAFVIKQFCQYCLLSFATSTGIFILAGINFWKTRKIPL